MLKPLSYLLLLFPLLAFGQKGKEATNSKQILNAFNKADEYMSTGHYDSAQVWLNKIYLKVSYRRPSLFSYFLTSRQAEVYYYNNLHELGMQEAYKAENIAKVLKDSLLLSDAYNFIGLFHLNEDKIPQARKYFKLGLSFVPRSPGKKQYIELTDPYHIYGNLAETFEKSGTPDSAIYYCRLSLKKAREIRSARGEATGAMNLAMAFIAKQNVDSARKYFGLSRTLATASKNFDVELTSYSGLAQCAAASQNKALALDQLDKGSALLKKFPQINDYYLSIFLETAIKIYKKYNDQQALIRTLQLRSDIQQDTHNKSNTQIRSLLSMGLQNEKTIFNLELTESKNKQSLATIRSYILLLACLLITIAFIAYRYHALQRIRLADIRSKIGQDLHDEVGATLSGIAMYSYITKEQIKNNEPEAVNNSLDIIKDNAGEMVAKLNDIVWAVNPVQDHLLGMIHRLKEFAIQIAAVKDIKVDLAYDTGLDNLKLPMEVRKNIYLICKEAVNNSVKYSESSVIRINIAVSGKHLHITIADNGKGFIAGSANTGNGLLNMKHRAKEINAKLSIDSAAGEGVKIKLSCKIT